MKNDPKYRFHLSSLALLLMGGTALAHEDDPKANRVPIPNTIGAYDESDGPAQRNLLGGISEGVILRSSIPLSGLGNAVSGSDCWGYVSPSGREYALVTVYDGMFVYEITDPGSPQEVGFIAGPNSDWHDVKVFENYCYVVSEGGQGIQVVSLENVDSGSVALVNTVTSGGGTDTHNVAIDEASGFLYRCGGGNNGLRIYSLADPEAPSYVAQWDTRYVHDAQVVTYDTGPWAGRQIAFCCSGFNQGNVNTGLDILDVTNKSNIQVLANLVYPAGRYSHQCWIDEERKYVYLNDELDEGNNAQFTKTFVFDVEDLENPFLASTFDNGNTAVGHNLYVKDNLLYEANYTSGMRVFDLGQNPLNPPEIAYYDTIPSTDAAIMNGLWSIFPYFPSGTVIGSDFDAGFFVWTVTQPLNLQLDDEPGQTIPSAGFDVSLEINAPPSGGLNPDSPQLRISIDGSEDEIPLFFDSTFNRWRGTSGPLPCASAITWSVEAENSDGVPFALGPFAGVVADEANVIFEDGFESNLGWSVSGTANDGQWTRGVPITNCDRGNPTSTPDNSPSCFLTDNSSANGCNSDVDEGSTVLTSPILDATDPSTLVSYWRWHNNSPPDGAAPNVDPFQVQCSSNAGATWIALETVQGNSPEANGGWFQKEFLVSDFVPNTASFQIRFVSADIGEQSIVESAIDGFALITLSCDEAPPSVEGDVDGDGDVDFDDLIGLLAAWGPCGQPCPGDADGNGAVEFQDLIILLGNWG